MIADGQRLIIAGKRDDFEEIHAMKRERFVA